MSHAVAVGLDIGATKIDLTAVSLDSGEVARRRAPGWHWRSADQKALIDGVRAALEDALAELPQPSLVAVGAGIAGLDWDDQEPMFLDALSRATACDRVRVANDACLPLFSEGNHGYGIAVVAGTGCNCRGILEDGRSGRVVGTGEWNGEYGSAACLVRDATRRAVYSWVSRGPETAFSEILAAAAGVPDLERVVRALASGDFSPTAVLATEVFRLAAAGDSECQEVLRWGGRELSELVRCVAAQMQSLDEPVTIVLGGSVVTSPSILQSTLIDQLASALPLSTTTVVTAPLSDAAVRLGVAGTTRQIPSSLQERT